MSKTLTVRLSTTLLLLSLLPSPALAVSKDMVQLQTQIQQLQDAVARLQQSNDERMGVLKDLTQQSSDSVNRMSATIDTLQKQLVAQQTAEGTKVDQVSGQIQALNDSLDEIKARMNRLEKVLADVQNQQGTISAGLQNLPQTGASTASSPAGVAPAPSGPDLTTPAGQPLPPPRKLGKPSAAISAPPVEDLYKAAYGDYMAAKYPLATSEFDDVIKSYPDNSLAGNAFYYLGEMEYRAGRFAAAAQAYDKVLERFPDNNKIPAAHLHKGQALLALKQNDAGVRELRALIQRFPNSPEATQARSRLSGMGVSIKPR